MKFKTYAEAKSLNKKIECVIDVNDENGRIISQYELTDAIHPETKQEMRCIVLSEKAAQRELGIEITGNATIPLNQKDWGKIKACVLKIKENEEKQYQKNKEKRKQARDQKIKKLHLEAQKTGQRQILNRSCNSSIAIANEYTTYTTIYVTPDGSITVDDGKWNRSY